jgi:hypothetical protein
MVFEKHSKQGLNLLVEPELLDDFCKKILSRSRNMSNTHEALTVLEAFISTFSSDSKGSESYKGIHERINSWTNHTRQRLLEQKSLELAQALTEHRCDQLADIYISLSRNGFYQILASAIETIPLEKINELFAWVIHWSDEARLKAEKASGYPDALDFIKANIKIEQYLAMSDIAHFIKNRS